MDRRDVFICNTLNAGPPAIATRTERDRGLPGLPAQPGRADRADRDLHAGELLDQAAAGRHDRHLAAARPARRCGRSGRGPCGCTRCTTRRPRSTRRRRSRRCGPTSTGSPSCWRSGRPSSRSRAGPEPGREPEPAADDEATAPASAGAAGPVLAPSSAVLAQASSEPDRHRPRVVTSGAGRLERPAGGPCRGAAPSRTRARRRRLDAQHDVGEPPRLASTPAAAGSARSRRPRRARSGTTCASARACTGPRGRWRPAP